MEPNEDGPYTWRIGGHDYLSLVSKIIFRSVGRIMIPELAGISTPTRNQKLNSSPLLFLRDILPSLVYVCTAYLPSTTNETQDVDWHASHQNVFASVGDDKMLMM
jgi:hypothetical protein